MILTVGRKSDLFLFFLNPIFPLKKGLLYKHDCSLIFQNFSAERERIFRMHIKDKGSNKS